MPINPCSNDDPSLCTGRQPCGTRPFSRRDIVMRFAATVARLLNAEGAETEIDHGEFYYELIERLSGQRGKASELSLELTGASLVTHRYSAHEAADIYFRAVLERRLFLARSNFFHKGHELMLALCRRGIASSWTEARLIRRQGDLPQTLHPSEELLAIRARLATCPVDISKGNPAASTRETQGALLVEVRGELIEIPEELSIWGAILGAPRRMRHISGQSWTEFRNTVIQAVETANAPYAAYLTAGLWPPDWEGLLSTHQVKQISAFVGAVRQHTDRNVLATWRAVWSAGRQIANFEDADAFWQSDVGCALRDGCPQGMVSSCDVEALVVEDAPQETLDETSFHEMLELCCQGGVINELEKWLYLQLYEGRTAVELAKEPAIRQRLRKSRMTMESYLETLQNRVHSHVESLIRAKSIPI